MWICKIVKRCLVCRVHQMQTNKDPTQLIRCNLLRSENGDWMRLLCLIVTFPCYDNCISIPKVLNSLPPTHPSFSLALIRAYAKLRTNQCIARCGVLYVILFGFHSFVCLLWLHFAQLYGFWIRLDPSHSTIYATFMSLITILYIAVFEIFSCFLRYVEWITEILSFKESNSRINGTL